MDCCVAAVTFFGEVQESGRGRVGPGHDGCFAFAPPLHGRSSLCVCLRVRTLCVCLRALSIRLLWSRAAAIRLLWSMTCCGTTRQLRSLVRSSTSQRPASLRAALAVTHPFPAIAATELFVLVMAMDTKFTSARISTSAKAIS